MSMPFFCENSNDTMVSTEPSDNVIDLFEKSSPVFCHEMQDVAVRSGDEACLECQMLVPLKPVTNVLWKDAFGHVIKQSDKHVVTFENTSGRCTLRILKCGMSDAGRYVCTATNDHGSASTSAVLSAIRKNVENCHVVQPSITCFLNL